MLKYADYVDAWELWNEPANPNIDNTLLRLNVPSQENMTKIVDFYFQMVQTASPIIRQYDPTATIVLFGGLNLYSGGERHLTLDKDFAQQLAAKNIEQYGDAISVHAYSWNQTGPHVWGNYTESLAYYRGLFQSNKSLEVWVTETGQFIDDNGEDRQAKYMVDALGYFNGNTTRVFWYSLLDNAADGKNFGLIDNENMPRPAYYKLQNELK